MCRGGRRERGCGEPGGGALYVEPEARRGGVTVNRQRAHGDYVCKEKTGAGEECEIHEGREGKKAGERF